MRWMNCALGRIIEYRRAMTAICSNRLLHVGDVESQREACRCARAFIRSGWAEGAALARYSANELFAKPVYSDEPDGLLWQAGAARVVSVDTRGIDLSDGRRLARAGVAEVLPFTGASAFDQAMAKVAARKRAAKAPQAVPVAS